MSAHAGPRPSFYWYQNTKAVRREILEWFKDWHEYRRFRGVALEYDLASERWRFEYDGRIYEVGQSDRGMHFPAVVEVARKLPGRRFAINASLALDRAMDDLESARASLHEAVLNLAQVPSLDGYYREDFLRAARRLPMLDRDEVRDVIAALDTIAAAEEEAEDAAKRAKLLDEVVEQPAVAS